MEPVADARPREQRAAWSTVQASAYASPPPAVYPPRPASEPGNKVDMLYVDPTAPLMHQAAAFGECLRHGVCRNDVESQRNVVSLHSHPCATGNVKDVENELAVGWHVDMTDNYGRTALHHAALNGEYWHAVTCCLGHLAHHANTR
jgi:hypothetical protein